MAAGSHGRDSRRAKPAKASPRSHGLTRRRLERYVRRILDRLAKLYSLHGWTLEVTYHHDGANYGTCSVDAHYRRAAINLNLELAPLKLVPRICCHEFAHIILEPAARFTGHFLDDNAAKAAHDDVHEQIATQLEDLLLPLVEDIQP